VSEESIPEGGERKNVSELARSYHLATRCGLSKETEGTAVMAT